MSVWLRCVTNLWVSEYPLYSVDQVRKKLCSLCVVEERPSDGGYLN